MCQSPALQPSVQDWRGAEWKLLLLVSLVAMACFVSLECSLAKMSLRIVLAMPISLAPALRNFLLQMSLNRVRELESILERWTSISVSRGANSSCPTSSELLDTSNIHSSVPSSIAMIRRDCSTELKSIQGNSMPRGAGSFLALGNKVTIWSK